MKRLLLVLFLVSLPAFAIKEYYSISRSIRALGMGGTFYGLSDDEGALFYNPAGLSLYKGKGQIYLPITAYASTNAVSAFSDIKDAVDNSTQANTILNNLQSLQGEVYGFGLNLFPHLLTKNFGIGLLLADTKANLGLLGRDFDTSIDGTAISDTGLFVGYARSFFDKDLHIGVTLKAIARAGGKEALDVLDVAQGDSLSTNLEELGGVGGGIDIDLGLIYELPDFVSIPWLLSTRAGISFNNLIGSTFPIQKRGNPPGLPRTMSLGGVAFFKGIGWIDNFIVVADLAEFSLGGQTDPDFGARVGSFWKHVNIGVEVPMRRWFALRTGFRQGLFTAGLGLNLKFFKLDLAYYGEELARGIDRINHRRVALRLSFGAGDWYNEPITVSRREEAKMREQKRQQKIRQAPKEKMITPEQKQGLIPEAKKRPEELKKEAEEKAKEAEEKVKDAKDKAKKKRKPQSEEESSEGTSEKKSETPSEPDSE